MKVFAYCWTCNKKYDVSRWSGKKYGVKCTDCSGYVISPSGKIKFRIIGDYTKPPEPVLKVITH